MKHFLFIFFIIVGLTTPVIAQQAAADLSKLTLQDAMRLALRNNLDIQVEQFNPEIGAADVRLERAKFEPLFSANLNNTNSLTPTGSILSSEQSTVLDKNFVYNLSWDHLLPTGTSYNVSFNNTRVETTQAFTTFNPRFNTTLFASVTQPLMRGFGLDITQAPLHIAQKNRQVFDYHLRQRMMDIGLQVEQIYWDLVFARRNLDVQKQALASAQDLYENNKKQVEVGTMAPLEIVVAEAEVASREQDIITAEALIQNTEDHLKTLILGGKDVENWPAEVYPADEPVISTLSITEDEAISRALAENPDLKALQIDVDSKALSAKLANNQLKPQLDFRAELGYTGLGGTTLVLDNSTFPPTVIDTRPGGYPDALSNLFNNRTWSVGFIVGIPIGNGTAQANYARADLTEKQAGKTLENARQQTILNLRTTYRNLQSDAKRLEAARVSRVLQEKKLDAERKKLAVGLSTNHVVLDFQKDLAAAQSAELQAMVDYNKDHAQLERYMGQTLQ